MQGRRDDAAEPLSERIGTGVCAVLAVWTLCAHAVVAAGGSLPQLLALFAVVGGASGLALWRRAPARVIATPERPDVAPPAGTAPPRLRQLALAVSLAALALAWLSGDGRTAWGLLVSSLALAAVPCLLLEPARFDAPVRGRGPELGLAALALLCALYALAAHRPDSDDTLYVNMAVAAVDRPDLPLLGSDTLHGLTDQPMVLPVYQLHSYELLIGALSLLTGLPAVAGFHFIAAALAGALVPLAHASLFRRLTPAIWPVTTLALVFVLLAVGETHRWYGNFGLVRIWQGKAVLLFVLMPLVYVAALRFARRGDRGSWLLLAAAQIAALGCTATALWAAPAGASMALASALRPDRAGLRRLALGALASGYPIAAGLLLQSGTSQAIPDLAPPTDVIWGAATGLGGDATQVERALVTALGEGRVLALGITTLFVGWACCAPGLARRFAIALPLAAALVLLCPYTEDWVSANLTGPVYWRAAWALPVPILFALVLVAPLRLPGRVGRVACAALLTLFALTVPRAPGFSRQNGVELAWPKLKLSPEHRWSQRLNELAPGGAVVAPGPVSSWIPVFHRHAYPLAVRHYLRTQRPRIGEREYRERVLMTRFAGGDGSDPEAAAIFASGLERYEVQAVCLSLSRTTPVARRMLREAGFERRTTTGAPATRGTSSPGSSTARSPRAAGSASWCRSATEGPAWARSTPVRCSRRWRRARARRTPPRRSTSRSSACRR
jgi:hypothetical protein